VAPTFSEPGRRASVDELNRNFRRPLRYELGPVRIGTEASGDAAAASRGEDLAQGGRPAPPL